MGKTLVAKLIVFATVAYFYIITIHKLIEKVTDNKVASFFSIIVLYYVATTLIETEV